MRVNSNLLQEYITQAGLVVDDEDHDSEALRLLESLVNMELSNSGTTLPMYRAKFDRLLGGE